MHRGGASLGLGASVVQPHLFQLHGQGCRAGGTAQEAGMDSDPVEVPRCFGGDLVFFPFEFAQGGMVRE